MSTFGCSSVDKAGMKELKIVSEASEKPCTDIERAFLSVLPLMEELQISSVYTFNVEKKLELIVFKECEIKKYGIATGIAQSEFTIRINKIKYTYSSIEEVLTLLAPGAVSLKELIHSTP